MRRLNINRKRLLYDISNYAYIEGHKLESTGGAAEEAHLMTDICAEGNIDRVNRVLDLAWATVRLVLGGGTTSPRPIQKGHLKPLVHEYLVCRVLADWLEIVHAPAAKVWQEKADKALAYIRQTTMSVSGSRRRPTGPW